MRLTHSLTFRLQGLAAATAVAVMLAGVITPAPLFAQVIDDEAFGIEGGTFEDLGDGPRTDPYSDAPIIQAPKASDLNSFASTESAAPDISLANMPGGPVVVELFTSQGCNSCPPADAMLAELANDPDILPLSYHVDYWDYLGWPDKFARPEFTRRQKNYARSVGERAVYTPQMIVGGQDTAPAVQPADLMGMIDAHRAAPAMVNVTEHEQGGRKVIELTPLSDLGGMVGVVLVRFVPERRVEVTGGENVGRSITYRNVVVDIDRLANWDGRAPLRLTIGGAETASKDFPPDTRHAILIQLVSGSKTQMPGPILTALRLD